MYLESTLLGALVGSVGTAVGGLLAIAIGQRRADLPRLLMAFAGGVMTAVVFFDLFIESADMSNILTMSIGAAAGGIFMALLSPVFTKDHSMASVGILILIGIALHNLPEGLAVGSSLAASPKFAISLSLLMILHNIPEGLAVCLPLRLSGMPAAKMLFFGAADWPAHRTRGPCWHRRRLNIARHDRRMPCVCGRRDALHLTKRTDSRSGPKKKRVARPSLVACVGVILTTLV